MAGLAWTLQDMKEFLVHDAVCVRFVGTVIRTYELTWYILQRIGVPLVQNAGYEWIIQANRQIRRKFSLIACKMYQGHFHFLQTVPGGTPVLVIFVEKISQNLQNVPRNLSYFEKSTAPKSDQIPVYLKSLRIGLAFFIV